MNNIPTNNNVMNMNMINMMMNNMPNNNMMFMNNISNNNNMMYMNNMNMMNNNMMMNNTNNSTINRLNLEYKLCDSDNELKLIGCTFGLVNNNIFNWKVSIIGPAGTPYAGGVFTVLVFFPNNYPKLGAEFRFQNKICHLNVDWRDRRDDGLPGDGHICLTTLNEWRSTGKVKDKKGYGVKQALFDIFCLFYNQGTESPYDEGLANLYLKNPEAFNEKAKKWTQQYAN